MTNKFPFNDVDDSTFTELFSYHPEEKVFFSEFSLDDKLEILLSHSSKSNWYAHTCNNESDPHDNFTHKYDIKPNFHYYDIDDFRKTQATWNRNNTLTVFHTNISSLRANIGKVEDLLADLAWNFDVIALSETRNDEKNKSNFTPAIIDGYHTYDGVTGSSQNGGVGFYVKDTLTKTPRTDLELKIEEYGAESETHWVELAADAGPSTLIGVFYRHPSAKAEHFMVELVKKLKKEKKKVLVQAGGNDLAEDNRSPACIAQDVIEIAIKAKQSGVKDIFVGSVPICSTQFSKERLDKLNNGLLTLCQFYDFVYIDNSKITVDHLYDGVHLKKEGTKVLADNYLNALRRKYGGLQ